VIGISSYHSHTIYNNKFILYNYDIGTFLMTCTIYIYNSIELNLSVRKLLPQFKYNQLENQNTCEAPHGECHGEVDGGICSLPEKNAA
jgi:hypothetical protein